MFEDSGVVGQGAIIRCQQERINLLLFVPILSSSWFFHLSFLFVIVYNKVLNNKSDINIIV